AHYTGIPGLNSAARNTSGDTVTLTFGTPFVDGVANTLTTSGVADVAGNILANPFVFNFTWNGSTPKLVITEINYNPPSNDPDTLEFIEIYNNGSQPAPLGGLKLDGVVNMTFPVLTLAPGATFLIAANKPACETFFAGQTFYQWNSGSVLTNGGNTLVIRNTADVTLDTVQYDDVSPWPVEADGAGPSAELLSPNLNNNDGANWKASTTATSNPGVFASPGVVTVASLPTIGFATARTLKTEKAGSVTVQVNITNMTVPFAEAKLRVVSASTAVPGEDYVLVDTTVTFLQIAPDPFLVTVNLVDDNESRNSRYLILQLTDFVASEAGSIKEHALLINDDDTPAPQPKNNSPVALQYLSSFRVDPANPATAEISAYDPASKRLFTTNIQQNRLEIIDFKNPNALAKVVSIDISPYGGGINSVAFSNGTVAVAVDDTLITNPGKVVFFNTNGDFVNLLTVGALPDHVSFSADGARLLVANEGEPATDYSVDPEGSVSLIDMTPGVAALTQANVTEIGFTAFDADIDALRAAGVRIFGPTNSVSKNVEPEYITESPDGKTAWVTLQEANAVAIIDLENKVISSIVPLGLKDYTAQNISLDASDQAPGVFFNNWKIKGMYQPDAIAYMNSGGQNYLVTANEGDVREWNAYTESVRLNASTYKLDPTVFPDAAYLKRTELLGRLNVTTATGDTDGDGDFDEIHAFGGRSVSIWNASTGQLVWDSGDDLERITAADPVYGGIFNASNANNTLKNRSDDKGPEPEGVALGVIEGRNYLFAVLERIGGVMMYDITDPMAPEFIQWINTRAPGTYSGDQGPEGIIFIPKGQSPNGRNLLVVSNEISGTISVFQIDVDKTQTSEYSLTKYAFDDTPAIGVYGDTIQEGGISGLMYRDGSFRFISDRGPNADATSSPLANGATALVFPFPDYTPKVWQVKPENGALLVEGVDFLKRPDGTGVSGLPLPVGQGNTGEVAWSDTLATVIDNDKWGIDSEGLTEDNDGNFWVCEEYGTSIWKLDHNFKVLNRYTPFPVETEDLPLDTLLGKRRANRGFEGIAYTPNGKIFVLLQSPANNPNSTVGNNSRVHRLVELDPATGQMRTFVYLHDAPLGQIRNSDWKIGDLVAVNNDEFLAIEHAERNGWNAKNIYRINLAGATPVSGNNFGGNTLEQLNEAGLAANGIVPVHKELFADLLELGWERQHDKPEGLTVLNDSTFAVINDNDFGISSPKTDGKIVLTGKTTRLYVYGIPAGKKLDYVSPYCKVDLGNDVAVCGDSDLDLGVSGQGFTQATWSDGSGALTLFVTEPGIYGVEAISQYGCRSRDTIVFTENPFPVIDLGPDADFCQGQSISTVFDAGNPGSVYHWNNDATTQSIVATAPGGYSVTVTNQFGCESASVAFVNVNPNPVINLGSDQSSCAVPILLDGSYPGATALWSTGDTTSTISVSATGAYSVQVTLATGCFDADTVHIQILPSSSSKLDVSVCEGGFYEYGGVQLSAGQSQQFTLINIFGCDSIVTVQVAASALPLPVVDLGSDSTLCEGLTLTLDAGNTGSIYTWSTGDTSQTIQVGTTDLYVVTVTNSFGCSASGDVAVSVVVCPATHEPALQSMSVFPNPTSGVLTIQFQEMPSGVTHLSVINTAGQVVLAQQQIHDLSTPIDLSGFPKGMYLLRLQSSAGIRTVRVAVQ
nr:choice-of-anchor I family protein [Saprospiraceae bacterium]